MGAGEVLLDRKAHRVVLAIGDERPVVDAGLVRIGDLAVHDAGGGAIDGDIVIAADGGKEGQAILPFRGGERPLDGLAGDSELAMPGVPADGSDEGRLLLGEGCDSGKQD